MRHITAASLFLLLATALSISAQPSDSQESARSPSVGERTFVVQITELRLNGPLEPNVSEADILKSLAPMREQGKVELIETIRLSALEHHECMVQFGKRVAVTTGFTFTQAGRNRSIKEQQVGSLVRLVAEPREDKVLVKFSYEASRLAEHSEEDTLPDTDSVQVSTTLLATPGQPMLIGSASSDKSSLLLVTVE